jgi:hypothetical protein
VPQGVYAVHVRCYLVVEHHADLTPLRDVLAELGVDVVTPGQAFKAPSDSDLSRWVPEVDFVLAVFPEGAGWETPPALYLDIGVAIGSRLPVLIVADPSRRIDATLSPLVAVRAALGNRGALRSRIGQFLRIIGTGRAGETQAALDAKNLDPFVVLGQLIAYALGIPFDARSAAQPSLSWPDQNAWPLGEQRPGQASPWDEGLTLVQLPEDWVSTLAEIDDEQLPPLCTASRSSAHWPAAHAATARSSTACQSSNDS